MSLPRIDFMMTSDFVTSSGVTASLGEIFAQQSYIKNI